VFVRYRIKESEVWEKTRHKTWGELGASILGHWKLFLYIMVLMTGMNLASHGTRICSLPSSSASGISGRSSGPCSPPFSMVGAILGGTLCGLFSDWWGRRRAMIVALLAGGY